MPIEFLRRIRELEKQIIDLQAKNKQLMAERKDIDKTVAAIMAENKRWREAWEYLQGKISKWPQMIGYLDQAREILKETQ